jgi:hypothetical protein
MFGDEIRALYGHLFPDPGHFKQLVAVLGRRHLGRQIPALLRVALVIVDLLHDG